MEANVTLPSAGLVYPGVDVSKIQVRSMKGKDEKLLAELNIDNVEKKYAELLKQLITGIDVQELTLGDRGLLLLWIKANSYSPIVKTKTVCEHCYNSITVDVDLTQVTLKELSEDLKEPASITLSDNSELKLRLFRVKDEIKVAEVEKKQGKANASLYQLALSIVDDKDIPTRISFLENLDTQDLQKIRKFHLDNVHGPELDKIKFTCPKCGSDEGVLSLPFRPDFLLPTQDGA